MIPETGGGLPAAFYEPVLWEQEGDPDQYQKPGVCLRTLRERAMAEAKFSLSQFRDLSTRNVASAQVSGKVRGRHLHCAPNIKNRCE